MSSVDCKRSYPMSRHAALRAQQRAVRLKIISFILDNADIRRRAGRGCVQFQISRHELGRMAKSGVPAELVERSSGVALVVAQDETIVTVKHCWKRACWDQSRDRRAYRNRRRGAKYRSRG